MTTLSDNPQPLQDPTDVLERLLGTDQGGHRVELESGVYHISRPLTIKRPVEVIGNGPVVFKRAFGHHAPMLRFVSSGASSLSGVTLTHATHDDDVSGDLLHVDAGELSLVRCAFGARAANGTLISGSAGLRVGKSARVSLKSVSFRGLSEGLVGDGEAHITAAQCSFYDCRWGLKLGGHCVAVVHQGRLRDCRSEGVFLGGRANVSLTECVFEGGLIGVGHGEGATLAVGTSAFERQQRAGVWLEGWGQVRLEASIITQTVIGIHITGRCEPLVSQCRIKHCAGTGVEWDARAAGDFEGNSLTDCLLGASVTGHAEPNIVNNTFVNNTSGGVRYQGSAAGIIRGNTARDNEGFGISVQGNASPQVLRNNIERQGAVGLSYGGRAEGVAESNLIHHNPTGIIIQAIAAPRIEANNIDHNQHHGVVIKKDARPVLLSNTLESNGRNGFFYRNRASGRAESNRIIGGRFGVRAAGESSPHLKSNICKGQAEVGAVLEGSNSAVLEGNTFEMARIGVKLSAKAMSRVLSNICQHNAEIGVEVCDQAEPVVERNALRHNKVGLRVDANAHPLLRDNTFDTNDMNRQLPESYTRAMMALAPLESVPASVPRRLRPSRGSKGGAGVMEASGWTALVTAMVVVAIFWQPVFWIAALSVSALASRRIYQRFLLVHGHLIEATVTRSRSAEGLITLTYTGPGGELYSPTEEVPEAVARAHPRGTTVPCLVHPLMPQVAIFPTLEGIKYMLPEPAQDNRPTTGAAHEWPDASDQSHPIDVPLYREPPQPQSGLMGRLRGRGAQQVGHMIWFEDKVEVTLSDGRHWTMHLTEAFVLQCAVWLTGPKKASLSLSLRRRGESGRSHWLEFCVAWPQARISRDVPVLQKAVAHVTPEDFEALLPRLHQAARAQGLEPWRWFW